MASPCSLVPLLVLNGDEIKPTDNYLQVPVDVRYCNISSHFQSDLQSLGTNVSTNKYLSIEYLLYHQYSSIFAYHRIIHKLLLLT